MPGINANTKLMLHFNDEYNLIRPYAHYKCNDNAANTTVTDDGSGANNGTSSTNTSNLSVAGKIGDAFDFNGTDEYVNLNTLMADIKTDTSGSICFWMYADNITGEIFKVLDTSGNTNFLINSGGTGQIAMNVNLTGTTQWYSLTATNTISTAGWYHVAVVQDGTSPVMYVNGVDVTNLSDTTDTTVWFGDMETAVGLDHIRLGSGYNRIAASEENFFDGKIDDFRYYQNHALSADAVARIYNEGLGTEGSGIKDSSPAGTHSTSMFATAAIVTGSSTKFGTGALVLDGDSDYLSIPDSSDWDICASTASNITIDVWVKHDDHAGNEAYIMQGDSTDRWILRHRDSIGIQFQLVSSGTNLISIVAASGEITDTNWHHLALCKVGTEYGIYLDGSQVGYIDDDSLQIYASALTIGAYADLTDAFDGTIDELRVQHSNYFNAAPIAIPYAHFKCNDDAANTTVTDDGSGANNGTSSTNTSNLSVAGKINDAFEFNGSSEYINADALEVDIDTDTSGAISFWVKPTSLAGGETIFSLSNSAAATFFRLVTGGSGEVTITLEVTGTQSFSYDSPTSSLSNGTWKHVVVVQDGVSPKVYINGVDQTLAVGGDANPSHWFNNLTGSDVARIGCRNQGGAGNTNFFNGQIDDFRYYRNHALTSDEIAFIYNSGSGTEDEADTITVPTAEYTASNLKRSQVVVIG